MEATAEMYCKRQPGRWELEPDAGHRSRRTSDDRLNADSR